MTNLIQPGLVLGNRNYPLACDINALCDIEAAFNVSFTQVFAQFASPATVKVSDFRQLLGAVIRHTDGRRLQAETFDEIMGLSDMSDVKVAVEQYLTSALGVLGGRGATADANG